MASLVGTSFGGTPIAWTPVIVSTAGSITSVTTNYSRAYRWSKWVYFCLDFTITTNGTGSGNLRTAIPTTTNKFTILSGRDGNNGRMLQCHATSTFIFMAYASDLAYPGVSGHAYNLSGMYEV